MVHFIQLWHIHQPTTQEDRWVDRAVRKAYAKILGVYERHPAIPFHLNITGCLLERLEERHPRLIDRVRAGVRRGQLHLTTTAYYQPIIPFIPKEHAVAQIQMNTERLDALFGVRPKTAWVPERVWEPWMTEIFAKAGVEAILLDDHLLRRGNTKAGEADTFYPWNAGTGKNRISVFLISREMRYLIPWETVEKTVQFMEKVNALGKEDTVVVFADDGEKMGEWQGSEGKDMWLDEFLRRIEDCDWLKPMTFEEYASRFGARGEAVFSNGSYFEMEEWCQGDIKNWLRHPVVGEMHSRLNLSIDRIGASERNIHILKAECNDPYWYARQMTFQRQCLYRNIILGERDAGRARSAGRANERARGRRLSECASHRTAILEDERQTIFFDRSGRISEWDLKDAGYNIVNTWFFEHIVEDKQRLESWVFEKRKRNCGTDFINDRPYLGNAGIRDGMRDKVEFEYLVDGLLVNKVWSLREGVLSLGYWLKNSSETAMRVELSPELCLTLPTDTSRDSVREWHRCVFDYAGNVVERPIENAIDGEGVCWSSVVDRKEKLAVGAAWRPNLIKKHLRYFAGQGAVIRPVFRDTTLEPGRKWNLRLLLWAGHGDYGNVSALLKERL